MFDNVKVSFVKKVTKSRRAETFDIEVNSDLHAFIARSPQGGATGVSHNSAMISLSNLSDDRMRHAKSGAWWEANPQRALSNNSAVYNEKPETGSFMAEWQSLYESKSGERGIFSREACQKIAARNGRRETDFVFGTNPCCLVGSTYLETMEKGKITIKDAVDMVLGGAKLHVLAQDISEDKVASWQPILAAQLTRENAEVIELEIETEQGIKIIKCTPDHPIYTSNRGYIRADDLTEEDELIVSI